MCAIGGIYLKPGITAPISDLLSKMSKKQLHRGPDFQNKWVSQDHNIGLMHNRLSIIDLSRLSDQPLWSIDGRYCIVFNGEIYNYIELRNQLIAAGSIFYTHGDAEVILESFRYWGKQILDHLRGMFSFCIYDHLHKSFFCARDRMGQKPFVYAQTEAGFIFASEIPAVRVYDQVDTCYDHDAIAALFVHNLRHIPDPYTAFKGIKRLLAGHAMLIQHGEIVEEWRYWTPKIVDVPATPQHLRQLLNESVRLRMRSDVPVAALLSGGVDSSAIVSIMSSLHPETINTYALGFDEHDEDLRRARLMANSLGTRHKELYFDPQEQWDLFNHLQSIYGEPIMLLPLIHAHVLCRAIHDDGMKVILNGNGADELFYGYTGHLRTMRLSNCMRYFDKFNFLFKTLKRTRFGWITESPRLRKAALYQRLSRSCWSQCLSKDAIETIANRAAEQIGYWGRLSPSSQYIDVSNFVGLMVENTHSVTTIGDLSGMGASVEVRSPFLDQEIVNFALSIDSKLKIPDFTSGVRLKAILRDAVTDLVPASLMRARKRGFGVGINEDRIIRTVWLKQANQLMNELDELDGMLDKNHIWREWRHYIKQGKRRGTLMSKYLAVQSWVHQNRQIVI